MSHFPPSLVDTQLRPAADRVLLLGLDCASPWLLFEHFAEAMPRLSALRQRGFWGPLRSCHPPITVPAWRIMTSGRDAGHHGVYGFRNRTGPPAYDDLAIAHAGLFVDPVWERLGSAGLRTTCVGLPGTFPPPASFAGTCVAGPLTPDLDAPFAAPAELASHIRARYPDYTFDVADYRALAPEALLEAVTAMTATRFELGLELAARDDWNLMLLVEIGLDRLHHALWHHVDPHHPRHVPNSPLLGALRDYHRLLDEGLGRLLDACDDGDTAFLVVSDHGARPMVGGFCINTWLAQQGYLTLQKPAPTAPTRFTPELVDWSRTRAWAAGGYYARVFINLQGREAQGVVSPREAPALLDELAAALTALHTPDGRPMDNAAYRPSELYPSVAGRPPDLMVYLDDLAYRALDTVGDALFLDANDSGFDAANHDWDGVCVGAGAGIRTAGHVDGLELIGVAGFVEELLR